MEPPPAPHRALTYYPALALFPALLVLVALVGVRVRRGVHACGQQRVRRASGPAGLEDHPGPAGGDDGRDPVLGHPEREAPRLVWIWISNLAILFGAEINAELDRARAEADGLPVGEEPYLELRDTRKLD